jgi:hypothetical protein
MHDLRAIYDEVYSSGITPRPAYAGMSDEQVAAALNAQTVPNADPIDTNALKLKAIEERIWGKLVSFASRAFVTTAAQQDLTNACRNFMAIFESLANAPLVRGNALWNAMDADLTLMTASTGGGPAISTAQANYMRALGDRTKPRWDETITAVWIAQARATFGG